MTCRMTWTIDSAIAAVSVTGRNAVTGYDLSVAPDATQFLGERLAALARSYAPTVIASWAAPDDLVLAHIVAVELGLPRATIDLDLGLIAISPGLRPAERAVLVSACLGEHPADPVARVLAARGHTLAAIAALGSGGHPVAASIGVETMVLA